MIGTVGDLDADDLEALPTEVREAIAAGVAMIDQQSRAIAELGRTDSSVCRDFAKFAEQLRAYADAIEPPTRSMSRFWRAKALALASTSDTWARRQIDGAARDIPTGTVVEVLDAFTRRDGVTIRAIAETMRASSTPGADVFAATIEFLADLADWLTDTQKALALCIACADRTRSQAEAKQRPLSTASPPGRRRRTPRETRAG